MVKAWASWEIFFQVDKVGEPITSLETQLRIKLMITSSMAVLPAWLSWWCSGDHNRLVYIYIYRMKNWKSNDVVTSQYEILSDPF